MEVKKDKFNAQAFLESLKEIEDNRIYVKIPEARQCLEGFLRREVGDQFSWLPEYDKVVEWLTNNNGKGLMCIGSNGRGKTLICSKAIPAILHYFGNRIVTLCNAVDMATHLEELKYYHILSIDDIGTESMASIYGNKVYALSEIIDVAEKKGKLMFLTSNLSAQDLVAKYGERTVDRLRSICKVVMFKGKSMR